MVRQAEMWLPNERRRVYGSVSMRNRRSGLLLPASLKVIGAGLGALAAVFNPEATMAENRNSSKMKTSIMERLLPSPRDAGFQMDGYFVWGGSMIKADQKYHLFASRWPVETRFPQGYRSHSEIVRATSDSPIGPFEFEEVVVSGRGGDWWDGKMCHNPKIVRSGDTFVLFYIGSAVGCGLRKCGYASAPSVTGPWTRREEPLPFGEDHNNPAPYIHDDGRVLIITRDRDLHMSVARASVYDGPWETLVQDLFPGIKIEDPDLHYNDGRYHMVVEDNVGGMTGHFRHGAHFVSANGVNWAAHDPIRVYDHTLKWDDGTATEADRRERPELYNANAERKGNGEPTHLLTGVKVGDRTWCHVQAIAPTESDE
jgi:hypothetical protein